jgi:hypothetical protein
MNIPRVSWGAVALLTLACDAGRSEVAAAPRQPLTAAQAAAELAAKLARKDIKLSEWERALQQAALALETGRAGELLALCSLEGGLEPRLSAIELLRRRAESAAEPLPSLPRPALAWLGSQVQRTDLGVVIEAAACRSLVAFGSPDDRHVLIERLQSSPRPAGRIAAAWGLEAARDQASIARLAEALVLADDSLGAELAASALEGILLSQEPSQLANEVFELLHGIFLPIPEHPELSPTLRAQGTRILAHMGGGGARATLLRLVLQADGQADLARIAAHGLARMDSGYHQTALANLMLDDSRSTTSRDIAAEVLLTSGAGPAVSESILAIAAERTRRVAEAGPSPEDRRRAVLALARVRSRESLSTIAHRAWADDEPGVRAAAIVALSLADTEGAYTYLLESASSDDSALEVRELARQALK